MTSDEQMAREFDWQAAAKRVDWMQILLNLMNGQETGRDGQPCFFIGGGYFCGRAKFWAGHDDQHRFVSLLDLLARCAAAPSLHKEEVADGIPSAEWHRGFEVGKAGAAYGTTECPLCGKSEPHAHTELAEKGLPMALALGSCAGLHHTAAVLGKMREEYEAAAAKAALHKEGAGGEELCECGQPENSIRHSFSAASSVDAHKFKPSKLRYCRRCNQRRYFVDGKCEMCAVSPAGRAEPK